MILGLKGLSANVFNTVVLIVGSINGENRLQMEKELKT